MKHTLLVLMGLVGSHAAVSQTSQPLVVLGAAGQPFQALGGASLDWTLGEVAIAAYENPKEGQVLLEGFHRSDLNPLLSPKMGPALTKTEAFPNPFRSTLTLNLPVSPAATLVQLFDVQGRLVRSFTLAPGTASTNLDLADLPLANYVLSLRNTVTQERWTQLVQKNK
ncbi:T9SS type A sorting domain-containing protein [Hymenobacter crusticola]|uniref:Secretion system C-terminal sorting domain-containing protein n=1 Tax=Hymenobacter crusticola TaxID=1770526 RepID=A0A243WF42_9BACT|nr:T9SS type A sorting domain-containing protein [Hymenobacter crusticola]OUJ74079.1 hypothetical protein BXP70_10070 [Hymenobacter crusticola]